MRFFATLVQVVIAGVLIVHASSAAAQQTYPSKPIRFITAYAPGGSTTTLARLIGQKLTESWGQQVIVDNRPGGSTVIGTEALVKSPPDGYTVQLVSMDLILIPQLVATPYDPIKDFAPVATISGSRYVLVLNPLVAANNLQEFIALAKSRPGQLNYATSGSGTASHLASELFMIMTGVKAQHIPYKGGAQGLADLIAGQVQLSFQNPLNVIPFIKSARLKAIAVTGQTRMPAVPQVPTFTEAGLPGYNLKSWFGVVAPAGTPMGIIDKLSAEVARILAMPDIKEKLLSQGIEPFISTPDQYAALIKADMAKFGKVIKAANIKIQ